MKYSQEIHGINARNKLIQGAKRVYRAVSVTLGSQGRNQVIWKQHRTRVLNDGVKTAQEVNPKDPFENAGAEIIKQSAQQQMDLRGDGTSLVVILSYWIAKEALKVVESGVNPMGLRSSLEKGRDLIIKQIEKLSKQVKTKEQKIQVATISSNDIHLGKLIGETYHKAGAEAVVTAEQVTGSDTYVDHQEGMQVDSGYKTEWFITSPKAMTATVTKARILVTDYKLDNIHELVPLINNLVEVNERNLVVIANDIEGNVLASLIVNKQKGQLNTLAIKAPSFQQEKFLQDLAVMTGAKFVSSKAKADLKKLTIADLGYAARVTSTKDATVIVEGGGKPKDVKTQISSIKTQLKGESSEFNREKLKERLAKLTGGVYTVKVGGATEVEAEERYERADDAIKATRAAIEGGIIPGGEVVFLQVRLKPTNEAEDYAYRILTNALKQPFNILVENAGLDGGEMRTELEMAGQYGIVVDWEEKKKVGNVTKDTTHLGVNVNTGKIVNMLEQGIIDPTLVATESIKNAISVATTLITVSGIIIEKEEKE